MSSDDCRCKNSEQSKWVEFWILFFILVHFYNKIVGLSENVWWSSVKFSVPFFIIFNTEVWVVEFNSLCAFSSFHVDFLLSDLDGDQPSHRCSSAKKKAQQFFTLKFLHAGWWCGVSNVFSPRLFPFFSSEQHTTSSSRASRKLPPKPPTEPTALGLC